MVDLSVNLSGIKLTNPVIAASGTFGFGKEHSSFYDINILGSFCTKGMTYSPRLGNPQPRIAECKTGMLNSVGLTNNGAEHIAEHEFEEISNYFKKPVIANVCGFTKEEYVTNAQIADSSPVVGIIELNVSCPNVKHGGIGFGTQTDVLFDLVKAVKNAVKKPLYVKLTPNVTDIKPLALSCEDAGADGICLINTLLGARIDIKTRKFVLANKYGGYSGQGIFPVALRMVNEAYNSVKIPIIGMGGITSAADTVEMMMAGATAVQVGTASLIDPFACKKIIEELPLLCQKLGIDKISEIVGIAR
jgi:dihydroorotate dehydrogenase (NAD+) catalytic subunit